MIRDIAMPKAHYKYEFSLYSIIDLEGIENSAESAFFVLDFLI